MFKVEIKKDEVITNYSEFPTYAECEAWAEQQKFDLYPKKTTRKNALDLNIDLTGLAPFFETDMLGEETTYYMLPPTQTILIEDVSTQKLEELAEQESSEAVELSISLKKYIRYLNKKKLKSGDWSVETFLAFIASPDVALCERLLNQASLASYKKSVVAVMGFYIPSDVAPITAKIDAHILKWQELGVL